MTEERMNSSRKRGAFNTIERKDSLKESKVTTRNQRETAKNSQDKHLARTQQTTTQTNKVSQPDIQRTSNEKASAKVKSGRSNEIVNVYNSLFGLSLAGITLSIAFIALFMIISIVDIASSGEVIVMSLICQVLTIIILVLYGFSNASCVKSDFDHKKASRMFFIEILLSVVVSITMVLGYQNGLTLIASISLIIISGIKFGLNQIEQ